MGEGRWECLQFSGVRYKEGVRMNSSQTVLRRNLGMGRAYVDSPNVAVWSKKR